MLFSNPSELLLLAIFLLNFIIGNFKSCFSSQHLIWPTPISVLLGWTQNARLATAEHRSFFHCFYKSLLEGLLFNTFFGITISRGFCKSMTFVAFASYFNSFLSSHYWIWSPSKRLLVIWILWLVEGDICIC